MMLYKFKLSNGKYFAYGAQASKALGKTEALYRLLSIMERHWQASLWWKN